MVEYKPKQDKLIHLLKQVEEFKGRSDPKELAKLAEREANLM